MLRMYEPFLRLTFNLKILAILIIYFINKTTLFFLFAKAQLTISQYLK